MGMPVRKVSIGFFSVAVAIAVFISVSFTPSAYSQESWQMPWSQNATENVSKQKKAKRVKRKRVKRSNIETHKAQKPKTTAVTVGAVTLSSAEKPELLTPEAPRLPMNAQAISAAPKSPTSQKILKLAQQDTLADSSSDTGTDIKPVVAEKPLTWDLKKRCTDNNGCGVHQDKLTQDSIKELQAVLQNIGCLAYAKDPTPNWGPASVSGFEKFIERSKELLGPSYNYDYATKEGKAFTRTLFLDQASQFKQKQRRFGLSGREATTSKKNNYLDKNCARLSYDTWDLRAVLKDEKLNKPKEFASKDDRFKPIAILRQKLERFNCLASSGVTQDSKVSWDEDAATAFSDYLCWSQTGKACPNQRVALSDKVSSTVYNPNDSYVRVLLGLMKENDEPVFCHGKTVDWDPSKTQSKPVAPFNYDREAVRRDQASKLRTELQNAGCLRQDKVKGIWGSASVNALTAYFKKLKEWGVVPKTFKVSGIEGKLFAAVASNFDKRVTQNAYVCDPPADYLRACDADKALSARAAKSDRIFGDLSTALPQALTRFETTENLALENMSGQTAKWLDNRLTKSNEMIVDQIVGLIANITNREQFLAFSDPGSDCGRCQLVGAFRHLLSYSQFVNSAGDIDQEPVTTALPDGTETAVSPSRILSAAFEDGDKKMSVSIPLSEINLRMIEYAYPSILDWHKEWKKYIHSLATKRTSDELQYRYAMAGLGSVILQLNDAWKKDKKERASSGAASSPKLLALVGDYRDACKATERFGQSPLALANQR